MGRKVTTRWALSRTAMPSFPGWGHRCGSSPDDLDISPHVKIGSNCGEFPAGTQARETHLSAKETRIRLLGFFFDLTPRLIAGGPRGGRSTRLHQEECSRDGMRSQIWWSKAGGRARSCRPLPFWRERPGTAGPSQPGSCAAGAGPRPDAVHTPAKRIWQWRRHCRDPSQARGPSRARTKAKSV